MKFLNVVEKDADWRGVASTSDVWRIMAGDKSKAMAYRED